jgi:PAS domain S-box-containing protein
MRIFLGVVACTLAACCARALALDPALDVNQYAHTAWKIRDGFSKGAIDAIAQTPDGYLWLGSEFGLLRFDGVRNVAWQPPEGQSLPGEYVRSLLAARDGTLWIGTLGGLASLKQGKLTLYPEFAGQYVDALLEDREGTVWVGANRPPPRAARLCAIRDASVRCEWDDGGLGQWVASLHEDRKGSLWVMASNGLWRMRPGPPTRYSLPESSFSFQSLVEGDDGTLVILTRGGMWRLVDGKIEALPLPGARLRAHAVRLLRDRSGGLWIGTAGRGLLHVRAGRTDIFARADGLSGDFVSRLFEDREGNIWVATTDGLDRFREFAAATFSVGQGLSSSNAASVLAARDGSVWLGTPSGLNRLHHGRPMAARTIFGNGLPRGSASLFQDRRGRIWVGAHGGVGYLENGRFVAIDGIPAGYVDSITEDKRGNLWIAHREAGLLRVSAEHKVERIAWTSLGRDDFATRLAADPSAGGLWLGFFLGGVAYFADGRVGSSYTTADGLGQGRVKDLRVERDGTLWAATEGGLSRLKSGRVATLTSKNGLPCDAVNSTIEDDAGSFWLYTACGIARVARSGLDEWAAAADEGTDAQRVIRATVFDSSDGVRSVSIVSSYSPHLVKSADGRVWFATVDGVSVIDPRRLPYNELPPPVHIERIIADRKPHDAASAAGPVRLPPLARDLQIDYTATSLVAPEKMRFRYRLEGHDKDWQDAGNRRQAFYNDLPPGDYRFRVSASNNSGVWNEAGAALAFSVAPAYYQTAWFRLLLLAALATAIWAAYRWRVRTLTAHLADVQRENRERVRAEGELRQAEAELRSRQEMLDLAQKSARAVAFEWRRAPAAPGSPWAVTWAVQVSAELEELFGTAPGSFDGSYGSWKRLIHPEDWSAVKKAVMLSRQSGELVLEYRVVHPGGALRWVQSKGRVLFDARGEPERAIGFMFDVTEKYRAQEDFSRLERQLRLAQRLEAMGTLAGGIAHDFNNILGAILGYSEMAVRETPKGSRLQRDLESIATAGERGRALVDRILAFSRSGVGERVAVPVEKVVREALDLVSAKLPPHVTLRAKLHAGRAAMLGDPTQVHQVLMNLATNAVHAMPSGGTLLVTLDAMRGEAARALTIGSVAAGEYVVLRVADSGTGIPPEILDRIFDPFFTTKEVGTGTGLGLSLVHGIVAELGGAIDVASTPGAGSTFTVYLPRSGDTLDSSQEEEPELPRGDGQRVLVVDDEEPLVRLATRTLEELGYQPVGFTSSAAALAAFCADPGRFDALIADERMPGLSGTALIREVRGVRRALTLQVARLAREAGADEVLKKPVLARELATSLARVLQP